MIDTTDQPPTSADAGTEVLTLLRNRRSMTKSRPDLVPREMVETVIEAATWAPNHRRTEPWRFVVVTGDARISLGTVMAQALAARSGDREGRPTEEQLEKERNKPLRAPVVIGVGVYPSDDPRVVEIEEVAATAAGIENMLLAAQALGLGAMWRTGDAAFDPAIKKFLGLPEGAHLIAFIYLGYPEIIPPLSRTNNAKEKTIWLEAERR